MRHIVALRGDPPGGVGAHFMPHPLGYPLLEPISCAASAPSAISRSRSRPIPSAIPKAPSIDPDIDALKAKVDAGATRAITQFFFENEIYLRFLEKARARGITIPIVPGIMPMQNFKQIAGFAGKAGASVPRWLADRFDGLEDDPQTRRVDRRDVDRRAGHRSRRSGVHEFHFYTNNRADLVYRDLPSSRAPAQPRDKRPRE